MSKEKRGELIHDALNLLDEDMIEDVDRLRENGAESSSELEETKDKRKTSRKKFSWRRVMAVAASMCLLVIGSYAWENYVGPSTEDKINQEDLPNEDADMEGAESVEDVNQKDEHVNNDQVGTESDYDNIQENASLSPETQAPIEKNPEIDSISTSLGDKYHLVNNYVSVSVIPHKVWESAANEQEALAQAVTIKEEDRMVMDQLVDVMCESETGLTVDLKKSDPDMTYHLFFTRTDGKVVHCWLLGDGYIYYDDLSDIYIRLDRSIYATTFKILAQYW